MKNLTNGFGAHGEKECNVTGKFQLYTLPRYNFFWAISVFGGKNKTLGLYSWVALTVCLRQTEMCH